MILISKKVLATAVVAAMAAIAITPEVRADAALEIISGTSSTGSLISPGVYGDSSISMGGWDISFAIGKKLNRPMEVFRNRLTM
jgi:hypothetical protein